MKYVDAFLTCVVIVGLYAISLFLDPIIKVVTVIMAIFGNIKMKRYAKNVWLGIDNYESAKLGGHWEDTISSRLGKAQEAGSVRGTFLANRIDNLWLLTLKEKDHCKNAIELRNNKHQVTGR